jgi:alpha-1,6-mannosyltransferase
MLNRGIKNQKLLFIFALIVALILGIELVVHGYNYLNYISHIAKQNNDFESSYFRRGIEYIILNIIYFLWLIQNKALKKRSNFINLLKLSIVFLLIAFFSYPVTSDIYLYLQYGLMDINKINPFLNPAGTFTSDLSPFLVWKQSSTYGPISQIFFIISAVFTSFGLVGRVYVFKFFCLLGHTLNSYLIWRQLKDCKHQNKITLAYLLNPLLLFEHVANAHLDVFICTALIVLINFIKQNRYTYSILTIWIGFLTKTIPIIWLPLISVFLVRQRRWKSLLIAAFLSLAIVTALFSTVLPTSKAWLSILNPGVSWQTAGSLHNILDVVLNTIEPFLSNLGARPQRIKRITLFAFKTLAYLGFVIFYAKTLLNVYFKRGYSTNNLILDMGWTTLVLFLFATPWYQPWYCSILLSIAALKSDSWFFVLTSLTFCISSTCSYYLLAYAPEQYLLVVVSIITVVPTIGVLITKPRILRAIPHPWSVSNP